MDDEIIQDEGVMKRIEELVVSDWSSTMLVYVQGTEEGELCREIYSCYLKDPIWPRGVGDLVPELGEMCNWAGMPHTTTDPRFLSLETERRYREAGSHHPRADRSNLAYIIDQIPSK